MLETVAVAVHLQDVNVVGEPVKQSAGEPLGAEHVFSSHSLLTVRQRSRILWPNAPSTTLLYDTAHTFTIGREAKVISLEG